jgi:hypothetical protein
VVPCEGWEPDFATLAQYQILVKRFLRDGEKPLISLFQLAISIPRGNNRGDQDWGKLVDKVQQAGCCPPPPGRHGMQHSFGAYSTAPAAPSRRGTNSSDMSRKRFLIRMALSLM